MRAPTQISRIVRILIVDDDAANRLLLSRTLSKWGYEVAEARDGHEAWEMMQRTKFRFVISDWMMPRVDGPELCRRIRTADFDGYTYVLLLTSIDNKDALIQGLEAGADDFMVKPFHGQELRVRLHAGERVLNLEQTLEERNSSLRQAQAAAHADLRAAAEMQHNLLPPAERTLAGSRFASLFAPCSFVAGDIFNYFCLDEARIAFYLLDVAGHGVASAMLSFSLSTILSPHYGIDSPAAVAGELNRRFQDDSDAMKYFTMILGIVDTENDLVTLTQAGHPPPIYQNGGAPMLIGESGFPVGVLAEAEFEDVEFGFAPGDRLVLYSDGVTECRGADRTLYGTDRLVQEIAAGRERPLAEMVEGIRGSLDGFKQQEAFADDVTLLAIERS